MKTVGICALLAAGWLVLGPGTALAEEFQESLSLDAETLIVTNLVGKIEIRGHSGDDFRVEVHVRGEDASRENIHIESDEGRRATVDVVFPLRDEREYVYPELGHSETSFSLHRGTQGEGGWLHRLFGAVGGDRVRVRGSGRGLEVWADLEILVPAGGGVRVYHGAGDIVATNVTGDLLLDSQSGTIEAEDVTGEFTADTGNGHIGVRNMTGEVNCDTGSGHVEMIGVRGPVVHVDTGSGNVELRDVACEDLSVDTGSGTVHAYEIAAEEANIDTGSGGVSAEFVHMGRGDFVIDTGTGGIHLILPADASADIVADTGSGRIDIDVADAEIRHRERDEVALRVGRGDARVQLDTGSGSISIGN